jgi:ribosomal protein L11 methyltransferase
LSWYAFRVRPSDGATESVIAALFEAGAQGVQELDDAVVTHFPSDVKLETVASAVAAADPESETDSWEVPDADWSLLWRDGIAAHRLGRLTVAPPWLAGSLDPATTIVVEPGMAFGTGEHATTRGVVRLLQNVVRQGDVVADLGAGSAVLAIAAAKLGARKVIAVELDEDAIPNAEQNVQANCVADRVVVVQGDAAAILPLAAPVRVILANIISSVLVSLLPIMERSLAPDGVAILSGILLEERPMMLEVLADAGWAVKAEDMEDIWWSVEISPAS